MSYLFPRFAYAPVRCTPVAPFRNEISSLFSLFDDTARELQHLQRTSRTNQRVFNPRFDVKEDKETYTLEGEVPGFKESDLSIEWNNNTLAIRGRHETVKQSGKKPDAVEAAPATTPEAAIDNGTTTSETGSVNSHQATVEDENPTPSSSTDAAETTQQVAGTNADVAATTEQHKNHQPEVQHWISERTTGEFLRKFSFPSNAVNHEAIRASLESGILRIVVPKAAVPESRRINIE